MGSTHKHTHSVHTEEREETHIIALLTYYNSILITLQLL